MILQELVLNDAIRRYFGCFTLDVITSCCFGVETNSIGDPDNDVVQNINKLFKFDLSKNPKLLLICNLFGLFIETDFL